MTDGLEVGPYYASERVVSSTLIYAMPKLKRTADELGTLIKQCATQFGAWPSGMTMLIYPSNDSWDVMISRGKTPDEEEYRVWALWVAVQMQSEFDLRASYARDA